LYRGGNYGFPSAHASNAMVFALFVFFFAGNRKMWVLLAIFFWAALLGYSRIYLGVHYWLDVECGYLLGAVSFLLIFLMFRWLKPTAIEPTAIEPTKSKIQNLKSNI
jgi:undecaprenyl-diphosphatase